MSATNTIMQMAKQNNGIVTTQGANGGIAIMDTYKVDKSEKYRLVEEYGMDSFIELSDGSLQFSFPFTNPEYLISWVLSFGEKAELKEPEELRAVIQARLEKAMKKYME